MRALKFPLAAHRRTDPPNPALDIVRGRLQAGAWPKARTFGHVSDLSERRMLHAFKVHHSEVSGGIPYVLKMLSEACCGAWQQEIVVSRLFGRGDEARSATDTKLTRVGALGTLWSLPVAPTYPFVLRSRARNCDVLSVHSPFPLAEAVAAWSLPHRARLVIHWHSDVVRQRAVLPLLKPTTKRFLDRASRIIVSHDSIVEQSMFLQPYRDKITVIPYGINAAWWNVLDDGDVQYVTQLRREHPRLVVATGRLVGYKGFDTLIRAMQSVDGQLLIVGGGPRRPDIDSEIKRLKLESRVRLVGHVSRTILKRLLHAASVFALPSVSNAETFGLVQLEAMACNCAIVNTALPTAVPWVARHGREGITVPPGDPEALAFALQRLLDDPALTQRLAASGVARVNSMFTEARFVAECWRVYDEVLHE